MTAPSGAAPLPAASALQSPSTPQEFPASLPLALLAFHRQVGPIYKASQAKYGAFADLKTVLEAITPPLLDQGLVLTQTLHPAPEGGTSLRTTLTHAPSGDQIDSHWTIPALDQLLARVHELRTAVIERFPLDLQLAALGALPPLLPPRPEPTSPPGSAMEQDTQAQAVTRPVLPPPPARAPGLRLDDQIKGLYTLLGQLGTTTNPLHSIGGVVTYCRRYQILSLLSLSAEDNDGEATGRQDQGERSSSRRQSTTAPAAAANSQGTAAATPRPTPTRSRSRSQSAAAADTTPPPQAQAQAASAQATPQAPAANLNTSPPQTLPQAAPEPAPEPAPEATEAAPQLSRSIPLSASEVQGLIGSIRQLPADAIPRLADAFRRRFELPEGVMVSDYIRTQEHCAFIQEQCRLFAPAAA